MTLRGIEDARRPYLYDATPPRRKPANGGEIPEGWVSREVPELQLTLYAPDEATLDDRVAQALSRPRIEPSKLKPSDVRSIYGMVLGGPKPGPDFQRVVTLMAEGMTMIALSREVGIEPKTLGQYRMGNRTPDRRNAYLLKLAARARLTADQCRECGV